MMLTRFFASALLFLSCLSSSVHAADPPFPATADAAMEAFAKGESTLESLVLLARFTPTGSATASEPCHHWGHLAVPGSCSGGGAITINPGPRHLVRDISVDGQKIYLCGVVLPKGENPETKSIFTAEVDAVSGSILSSRTFGLPHEGFYNASPSACEVRNGDFFMAGNISKKGEKDVSFPFILKASATAMDHKFGESGAHIFHDFKNRVARGITVDPAGEVQTVLVRNKAASLGRLSEFGMPLKAEGQFASSVSVSYDHPIVVSGNRFVVALNKVKSGNNDGTEVTRLTSGGGMVDSSFGKDGFARSSFNTGDSALADLVLTDSVIYAVSRVGGKGIGVEAFKFSGEVEEAFSGDGKRTLPQGVAIQVSGATMWKKKELLIAATANSNAGKDGIRVIRVKGNGDTALPDYRIKTIFEPGLTSQLDASKIEHASVQAVTTVPAVSPPPAAGTRPEAIVIAGFILKEK